VDGQSDERRFEGGDALRNAAEQEARRKLTDDEWRLVDLGEWSAQPYSEYDRSDLAALVQAISQLPQPTKPSASERQRAQALAFTERTAVDAKEFVERQRIFLFGHGEPPFKNDARGAAGWIETQANQRGSVLFTLEIAVPSDQAEGLAPLFWIRDWLVAELVGREVDDNSFQAVRSFMLAQGSPVRGINPRRPALAYLAPTNGDWGIKRVHADDGTPLGNLREACDKLSQATTWTQLASCHHLLTGGVMSSPVQAIPRIRGGRESFGGSSITIEVLNPAGVRTDEVARAYAEAREQIGGGVGSGAHRRRSTLSPKREQLAAFVSEHPGLKWKDRVELWNAQHPEFAFPTPQAMGRAFGRLT
jgi:hypothetical protein